MIARLLWFAETEFRLSKPQGDGHTLREHFAAVKRMTKKAHPEDRQPCPLPESLRYLWTYFHDIGAGRPVWQGGFLPIPATELRAWEELNEIKLESWELGAIRKLDALFLKIVGEK